MIHDLLGDVQRLVFASLVGWSVVSSDDMLEADICSGRQK